ncbi:interferon-inducible GTPase-domain-containing protein [Suillus spraguei]|nr:interferon-inducible GTPase-domain-containing protein [Suillus spraguei]
MDAAFIIPIIVAVCAAIQLIDSANKTEENARMPLVAAPLRKRAEEAEEARRAAEKAAERAQKRLEEQEWIAAEDGRREEEARLAVERKWFKGIRPECHPSGEDISRMKTQYHYSPGFVHVAVVGSAGAGKSSFINAVRGLSTYDSMAAPTGIVETIGTFVRYPDPHPNSRMIWYDIPGAGTPKVSDWQYFNYMGLYIFDCIIVLTGNRVLESDFAILHACEQFKNIEAFIVRSKSDQYINNMVCEKMPRGFDLCGPDMNAETRSLFLQTKSEERQRFIDETCKNMRTHLERENLPPKKVYIVCADAILAVVNNSRSPKAIDEADLLSDVREFVWKRLKSGCVC